MQFIDKAKIYIEAGKGGDGTVAFRREAHVPKGGPAGGDGGKGGSIIFEATHSLSTLLDLKYKRVYKARAGGNGMAKKMHGADAQDLLIKVPVGTVITNVETGKIMADLTEDHQRVVLAKGGRGGRGNARFATSRNPAPQICERGEPGEKFDVSCELKLLADVGLVGFPSVGKSTLLSVVSRARPEIADYHFTTIDPNLGVVKTKYGDSFVLADIPGIIEGASEGIGLGTQFLRHVERTRLLLHVIDIAGTEGRNPVEDFYKINDELKKYSEKLANRKQIIVANKIDSMQDDNNIREIQKLAKEKNIEVFKISAVTGEGLEELFNHVAEILKTLPKEDIVDVEDRIVYTLEDDKDDFTVQIIDGEFIVEGPAVERLMGRVNIGDNESYAYMERMLKKLGIEDELKAKGVKEGDTVKILEWEFEWYE